MRRMVSVGCFKQYSLERVRALVCTESDWFILRRMIYDFNRKYCNKYMFLLMDGILTSVKQGMSHNCADEEMKKV